MTAKAWYRGKEMISMLDRFVIDLSHPSWPLNRWLSAMFVLYQDDINELVMQRDAAVAAWRRAHPDRDVFEDRELEVMSGKAIDLDQRLAKVRIRLGVDAS